MDTNKKKIKCKYFKHGTCTRGNNCPYSHVMDGCKFDDRCNRPDCPYTHSKTSTAPKVAPVTPKVATAAPKVAPASNVVTKESSGKLTIMPPKDSKVTFVLKGVTYTARVLSSNYKTNTITLQEITGGIIYYDIPVNLVKPEIAKPLDLYAAMLVIQKAHDTCGNDVCPASITDDEDKYYEHNRQLGFYDKGNDRISPQYPGQSYEERQSTYRLNFSRMITECGEKPNLPTSGLLTSTTITLFETPREFRNARNNLTDAVNLSKQECRGCLSLVKIAEHRFLDLPSDVSTTIYDRLTKFKPCGECCGITYDNYSLDEYLCELECLDNHLYLEVDTYLDL